MKLKHLVLRDFRSYIDYEFFPSPGINIVVGKNASGKTNLLEAIYVLIKGKSFRTNRDKELINFNSQGFKLTGELEIDGLLKDYEVEIVNNKKFLKINQNVSKNLANYTSDTAVVEFSPEDLQLIKSGPSARRNFLDEIILSINMIYNFNLKRYNRLLFDRNALLKRKTKTYNNELLLDVFDIRIASLGAYIIAERKKWIEYINSEIKDVFYKISNRMESLELKYKSNIKFENIKEIEKNFYEALKRNIERDTYMGQTLVGPHRDELEIYIDNKALKNFGSQGQQRTVVLCLKITEAQIYKKYKRVEPIIILDDVFSELDAFRRKGLLDAIKNLQSFLSTTDELDFYNIKQDKNIIKL